ncbi:flippase [Fusobacterium varium]|uniref:flippase n=1 Tax=Fusobacterium varium TaxID=856 RepID=UPI001F176A30|nr:flippase [Fusobacterium varium]MCF2673211.1 flippase [Fusobacterium varium]
MTLKIKSLKHNFVMYFLRIFFNICFSIIIFPYVAKKISPEGLGKIQYVEAIAAYFILFINLGISNYGKREVAIYRNNKNKLSNITSELLIILLFTTFIGLTFYFLFIKIFINDFQEKILFFIFSLTLLLNFFDLEWFYIGIENQDYITKRNIIFKIISGFLIFVLVKDKGSLFLYSGIIVFSLIGSNILNFFYLKKIINLKRRKIKDLKKHLKPIFLFFFSALSLSIAYNLDSIMLMKIKGATELGTYSVALKFGKASQIFITAIVAITYPRICNYLRNNNKNEYLKLEKKIFNILLLFSIPASIGMFLLSKPIILLLVGNEFVNSIKVLQIFAILIFVISIAVFTGSLTLLANKKEGIVTFALSIGAILNIIFNYISIPLLGAVGAALATLIIEIVGIILKIILGWEIFKELKIVNKNQIKILFSSLIMGFFIIVLNKNISSNFFELLLSVIFGSIVYVSGLFFLKEELTTESAKKLKKEINERKNRNANI